MRAVRVEQPRQVFKVRSGGVDSRRRGAYDSGKLARFERGLSGTWEEMGIDAGVHVD